MDLQSDFSCATLASWWIPAFGFCWLPSVKWWVWYSSEVIVTYPLLVRPIAVYVSLDVTVLVTTSARVFKTLFMTCITGKLFKILWQISYISWKLFWKVFGDQWTRFTVGSIHITLLSLFWSTYGCMSANEVNKNHCHIKFLNHLRQLKLAGFESWT